jgi:Fe2+ transport system protein FeoA
VRGERLRVVGSTEAGACAQRLREFGILAGAQLIIHQGGDPVLLEILSTRLAIDSHTASCIEVADA